MLNPNSKIEYFLPQDKSPRQGRYDNTQRQTDYGNPQASLSQQSTQRKIEYGEVQENSQRSNYPSRRNSEAHSDSQSRSQDNSHRSNHPSEADNHSRKFRNDNNQGTKLPPKTQEANKKIITSLNKPLTVVLIIIIIILVLLALAGIIIGIVYGATLSKYSYIIFWFIKLKFQFLTFNRYCFKWWILL